MADYLTFATIYGDVQRAIKHFKSSQVTLVKAMINMTYFEMLNADTLRPIFWLRNLVEDQNIIAPAEIAGITQADPGVVETSAAHNMAAGMIVSLYNIVGMTELNNRTVKLGTCADTTHFQLLDLDGSNIATSGYTAYSSGGDVVHRGISIPTAHKTKNVISFNLHGHDGGLKKITLKELSKSNSWWSDSTSRPLRHMIRKTFTTAGVMQNLLLWFPGADAAYDIRLWLEMGVSPMSDDAHAPQMPTQFHYGIVAGTITRLIETGVQVENAVVWPGIYKESVRQLIAYNRKLWKEEEEDSEGRPFGL